MDSTLTAFDLFFQGEDFDLLYISDSSPESLYNSSPVKYIVEELGPKVSKYILRDFVVYGSSYDYKSFYSRNAVGAKSEDIPARNLYYMFLAASLGYETIIISIQKGESKYPQDRDPEVLMEWAKHLSFAFQKTIQVKVEDLEYTKSEYLMHVFDQCCEPKDGKAFKECVELSVSCYTPEYEFREDRFFTQCGKCSACIRRGIALLLSKIWTIEEIDKQFSETPLTYDRVDKYNKSKVDRDKARVDEIKRALDMLVSTAVSTSSINTDGFYRLVLGQHNITMLHNRITENRTYSCVFNIITAGDPVIYDLLDSIERLYGEEVLVQIVINTSIFIPLIRFIKTVKRLRDYLDNSGYDYNLFITSDPLGLPDCRNRMIAELDNIMSIRPSTPIIFLDSDVVLYTRVESYIESDSVWFHDVGRFEMDISDNSVEYIKRHSGALPYGCGYFIGMRYHTLKKHKLAFDSMFTFWCEDYDFAISCYDKNIPIGCIAVGALNHLEHVEQKSNPLVYTLANIQDAQKKLYDKWCKYFK